MKRVLFVAAENAALPGGKVGGIGDVVRDLPVALAESGWQTTVLTPAYGSLHELPGARRIRDVSVVFGGADHVATLYEVPSANSGTRFLVLDHPLLAPCGPGRIYCDDGPDRPFATDAHKFAFFCAAVAAWLCSDAAARPDVVHLHDWHPALLLLLRASDPQYSALRDLRIVYTIHNLALQGIRPLDHDASSLAHWYPGLAWERATVGDPRYADCINPMALAIRLADRVNTVSPTYAREVLVADDPAHGFYGAEGLEADTRAAAADGRLVGILNGCMYPPGRRARGWQPLARVLRDLPATLQTTPDIATVLRTFRARRPRHLVTSVGRITDQKVTLFLTPVGSASAAEPTALDAILRRLGDDSLFVMLGSGDPQLQTQLRTVMARHANALFIEGFAETLAAALYDCGDLFLMPSSFEPCGISQMLAMRGGQPCVVHGVGGLRDTVADGVNGFVFDGDTPAQQANAFAVACDTALGLREQHPERWRRLTAAAAATRFTWAAAAEAYIQALYTEPDDAGRA